MRSFLVLRRIDSIDLDTWLSVSVGSPDTTFVAAELFQLPDLDLLLAKLQGFFTSSPSCLSMWRRNSDQYALFLNWDNSKPMDHGDSG